MKEEKMMILSMLEEGKITSEEAIKLMEALEDMEMPKKSIELDEEKANTSSKKSSKQLFETLGDIGNDIGNALEDIGNDLGNTFSKMFDGLKDAGTSFNFKGNYETIVTDLDMDLSNIENPSLDLRAVNGNIRIRPKDGDKVIIKSTCQYKNGLLAPNEPYFDFYMDKNKLIFIPKYNSNISIKLDVSLPEKHYNEITLNSSNGKIDIEELNSDILKCITTNSSIDVVEVNCQEIDLITKNSKIQCSGTNSNLLKATTANSNILLMDVTAKEVEAKTSNAKITANDIDAEKIIFKTSNSPIEVNDITCDTINLTTSNSRVILDDIDLDRVKEIRIATSNGSIHSEIDEVSKDIYFDLETSMGSISLDIPNLVYKLNKQANLGFRKIVAHSMGFDENKDHIKFTASTSNGSIKIS